MKARRRSRTSTTDVKFPRFSNRRPTMLNQSSMWFSQLLCFGVERKRMRWLVSLKNAARVGIDGTRSPFLLLTQLLLDATYAGDQPHQGLRLMRVELINDTEPRGLRIRSNSLGDRRCKVFLGSPWSASGRHHFPRRHVEVGDQTLRPRCAGGLCIRGALDEAWWHRPGWGGPLQGLSPRSSHRD